MALATTTNRNYPIVDDAPTSYLDTIIIPALAELANLIDVDVQALITGKIATTALDTDGTLAANDDAKIASQKATKTYANAVGAAAIAASQPLAARLTAIVATGIAASMFATNVLDTDATLSANDNARIASQSAVKSYVDNAITGVFWKPAADVATTGNITLSGEQTIDGVLTSASRVLVKAQTTASQNGLYLSGAGTWTRVAEADTGFEIWGATVMVKRGTVGANTQWTNTNATQPTLGSTSITFAQISGAGTYSATGGVILTGNQFSADTGTSGHKLPWLDGANIWSATQTISGTIPEFVFYETDAGTDAKYWRTAIDAGVYYFQLRNDAQNAAAVVYSVTRTAHTSSVWNFGANTSVQINGDPVMTRGAAETVGGAKTFTSDLLVSKAGAKVTVTSNTSADPGYIFNVNGGRQDRIIATSTGLYIGVNVAGTERVLTLSSAGVLGWAGTANIGPNGTGLLIQNSAVDYQHTIDKDNTGVLFNTNSGSRGFRFAVGGTSIIGITGTTFFPYSDNVTACGTSGNRWTVIYAGTGTINTSDMREKTPFELASDRERAFIRDVFMGAGWYQWLDAVKEKGKGARMHFGLGAQNVETLARKHGIDPNTRAFFCEDEIKVKGKKPFTRKGLRPDQLNTLGVAALFAEVETLRAEITALRKAA